MFNREWLKVYFILGSQNCAHNHSPLTILEQALQGGITCFQFREKGVRSKQGEAKVMLARQMQLLCREYQVPFIVNDDVDLAVLIGADGIHVGQDDQSIIEIRKEVPSKMVVGVSATNVEQARQAKADGADYLGVGPVFSTTTKEDAKQPIGLNGLEAVKDEVGNIPIVAIGGISLSNAQSIKSVGADGVSVISAISAATSPTSAVRALKAMFN
ncbi:thiamine-phosphate pyrophosphorylase [Amphibacillus marinus]|uniref:Thiamine-phosphate synthase n=1 Tax=Amphibacillus marinus TaxID=872970 RepID=A0A1H8JXG6_9BACI|nr:thiamine phosphate synthase [Amphibacillus marinus]SEN85380.1 thiamine-phosphate pyrophosphorylase [Amphibacillus marinus]